MRIRADVPALALAMFLAPVIAAAAAPLVDSASGLALEPPEGFVVSPAERQGYDVTFGVNPASGKPRRGPHDAYLCEIGFRAIADNKQFTQEQINDLWLKPAWQADVRATMDRAYTVSSQTPFELHGAAGLEFIGRPIAGMSGDPITTTLSLTETPRGKLVIVCVTVDEDFQAALPQFRAIREAVRPPR